MNTSLFDLSVRTLDIEGVLRGVRGGKITLVTLIRCVDQYVHVVVALNYYFFHAPGRSTRSADSERAFASMISDYELERSCYAIMRSFYQDAMPTLMLRDKFTREKTQVRALYNVLTGSTCYYCGGPCSQLSTNFTFSEPADNDHLSRTVGTWHGVCYNRYIGSCHRQFLVSGWGSRKYRLHDIHYMQFQTIAVRGVKLAEVMQIVRDNASPTNEICKIVVAEKLGRTRQSSGQKELCLVQFEPFVEHYLK